MPFPNDYLPDYRSDILGRQAGPEIAYIEQVISPVTVDVNAMVDIGGLLSVKTRGRPFLLTMGAGDFAVTSGPAITTFQIFDVTNNLTVAATRVTSSSGAYYQVPLMRRRLQYDPGTYIFKMQFAVNTGISQIFSYPYAPCWAQAVEV